MHVSKSTQPNPPVVEYYQNHMDLMKYEQKQDGKVCLLAPATNPKGIQGVFWQSHIQILCNRLYVKVYLGNKGTYFGDRQETP